MGKATKGKFEKSGRKKRTRAVAHDAGNARVQALRAEFRCFQGGKADNELYDGPGRAWAVGLFDGQRIDAIALRDAAREYADLYWGYYAAMLPKSPNMERTAKATGTGMPAETARERRFAKLDEAIDGTLASPVRRAIHALCVDHWGSDDISPWVQRLINSRRAMRGNGTGDNLASDADWAGWECALEALLAMAGGRERKVA